MHSIVREAFVTSRVELLCAYMHVYTRTCICVYKLQQQQQQPKQQRIAVRARTERINNRFFFFGATPLLYCYIHACILVAVRARYTLKELRPFFLTDGIILDFTGYCFATPRTRSRSRGSSIVRIPPLNLRYIIYMHTADDSSFGNITRAIAEPGNAVYIYTP